MNDKIYDEESKRDKHKTMNKLLVILGPTATGKTDLALQLAGKFQGELVSVDSRQVYVGLDIGTGKYPSEKGKVKRKKNFWEIGGIKIWMYDVLDPKKQYSVADYVKDATIVIADINKRGKLPIVVGGTGLYLKALLYGLSNLAIPVDKNLRKKLQKLSKEDLQERLKKLSPERWRSLNESDRQNPRRLVRAIELETSPRRSSFDFAQDHLRGVAMDFNVLKIGLTAPREILYRRVDERVIKRIEQGMVEEAKRLQKEGLTIKRMKALGLEDGVLADYLRRKITTEDKLVRVMQYKIHGYVRRQLTWFKKEEDVFWFDIADKHFPKKLANMVSRWYDQSHVTKNRHLS